MENYWSLTTLREKLIQIGAMVVTHVRYVIFQKEEGKSLPISRTVIVSPERATVVVGRSSSGKAREKPFSLLVQTDTID